MKTTLQIVAILMVALLPMGVMGQQTGIFQTYIVQNVGMDNFFHAGGANADGGTSFNNQDYGDFTSSSTYLIKGGEVKTFKNGGGDVFGAKLFYRVYPTGSTPGSFNEVNLPFESNLPAAGDQRWQETALNINVLSGLTSTSQHTLEVYWQITSNQGDRFDNNGGNNYKAFFDYTHNVNEEVSIANSAGWRMMSSPVSTTYATLLGPVWTQGFSEGADVTNGSPNVFTHSSSGFAAPSHLNTLITPGQGFIYHHFNDDNYDGTPNASASTLSVSGSENGAVTDFALATGSSSTTEGWTLMGNPFATTISWGGLTKSSSVNGNVYVYTSGTGDANDQNGQPRYLVYNGSTGGLTNGLIAPFQGFFVKADDAAQTISIPTLAKSSTAGTFRQKEVAPTDFILRLTDGSRSSDAWFAFTEDGKVGMDAADAYKLDPLDGTFFSLFSLIDGVPMDIQNLPSSFENRLEIPLSLKSMKDYAGVDGDFSLSLANLNGINESWDIVLVDHETNSIVDLRSDSYEFRWNAPREKMRPASERVGDPIMKTSATSSPRFTLIIDPLGTTSAESIGHRAESFSLEQNYPNPFNPSTVIGFNVGTQDLASLPVRLTVYDILGREVAVLINGVMPAGSHTATFDASNLTSGVYVYKLEAGGQVMTKRMTLVK